MKKKAQQDIMIRAGVLQRRTIYLLLIFQLALPWLLAICWKFFGLGEFPEHRKLEVYRYAERLSFLKYAISLCFSIIGATWFLAAGRSGKSLLSEKTRLLLRWSWTLMSVGIISAALQIFLSYKDCYYWPLIEAEGGYPSLYQEVRHCAYTHMLHFSYRFCVGPMFFGGVMLVLSLTGVLLNSSENSQESDEHLGDGGHGLL